MKKYQIINLALAVVMFALAGVVFISQVCLTGSFIIGFACFAIWALVGGLAWLSWNEFKSEEQ